MIKNSENLVDHFKETIDPNFMESEQSFTRKLALDSIIDQIYEIRNDR